MLKSNLVTKEILRKSEKFGLEGSVKEIIVLFL